MTMPVKQHERTKSGMNWSLRKIELGVRRPTHPMKHTKAMYGSSDAWKKEKATKELVSSAPAGPPTTANMEVEKSIAKVDKSIAEFCQTGSGSIRSFAEMGSYEVTNAGIGDASRGRAEGANASSGGTTHIRLTPPSSP